MVTTTQQWDGKPIRGGIITTPFGIRGRLWSTDRNSNGEGIHTGDDWNLPGGTPIGTPVYAVADGTVTIADGGALGLMSILRADNGRVYKYCHLREGSRDPWNGERVQAGQKLAEVGNTGNTTAPHLHLEDTDSATTWPGRVRKPSWPMPAQGAAPKQPKGDDMRETREELDVRFEHAGDSKYDYARNPDTPVIGADVRGPIIYDIGAIVTGPEGAHLRVRLAFLDRATGRWVGRSPEVLGVGNVVNFSKLGQTGHPGCSIYLDVWSDTAGEIKIEQIAHFWRA